MTQISLSNASFGFLSQGAIIQNFSVGGHNLVLSFPTPEPYREAPYFSETIGRVANRISNGLIEDLNGRAYQLATNQAGQNHLHGGTIGWGHRTFSEPRQTTRHGKDAVHFTYVSPDGEEGYPGTVELRVWYTGHEEDDHTAVLEIEYEVELIGTECKETVVNITNHSYFNLSSGATIEGTKIVLATDDYLATDENDIPTGKIVGFPGIRANHPFILGATQPAVDHCFVMDKDASQVPLDTRPRQLHKLVSAQHASTGLFLEVYSTEPAFQFYTGDYVDVPATEHGPARRARAGFCVEPGRFINAINVPEWRNQVVLCQGQIWGSRIVYKAWRS